MDSQTHDLSPQSIAIVGMAGRFPAARSTSELWRLLRDGKEATRWFSDDELLAEGVSPQSLKDPNYVRAGLVLPNMEMFDAGFFGFSPREAAILDPQHRHFLECSWEALEDAGYVPQTFPGAIGVFAGCGMQAYMTYNLLSNPDLVKSVGLFLLRHTGNDKDFLTTRLSYLLDLRGPSISVQTACSTSLVAVHMAVQSLLAGECDMALAGGVTIELPHSQGYHYAEGEILSSDGHCRAFDDGANGTIFGSGVGVVVLRRLADAIADRDNIHAVIRGSAVNNDGSQKAGYLAPSVEGQASAAAEALALASVEPSNISYIEAHGTGTPVGDPIELAALSQAYGGTGKKQFCGIGSIKTNIGHLDTAAGVTSLIKVVLALKNQLIPASLNFNRPNSRFDLRQSPFYVVDKPHPWRRTNAPRRAAVNSLGVGGTNAHVIVEEAPAIEVGRATNEWQVFALSAKTPASLADLRRKWAEFFSEPPDVINVADAAYTTQVGRRDFAHRCAVIARDPEGLHLALTSRHHPHVVSGAAVSEPGIVFMFPGGGAQYPGVGSELLERVPSFKSAVEDCFRLMPSSVPRDLRSLMFDRKATDEDAARELERPSYALPALFVLEYALAKMWESWGIKPSALIGHSAGEITAACIGGVMALSNALAIAALRGQLLESAPRGAMLATDLSESELSVEIGDDLDIAAVNAPDLCIATGSLETIDRLQAQLAQKAVECRRLRINVAAHSRMLDGVLDTYREAFRKIRLQPSQVPFISNLSGTWIDPKSIIDPEYWVRQLREPVRFGEGLRTLLEEPNRVLLEVGPGQSLCSLARHNCREAVAPAILASTRLPQETGSELAQTLTSAGHLWAVGASIDWASLRGKSQARRISVPTYAFERQRHWIEPGSGHGRATVPAASPRPVAPAIGRIGSIEDWFSVPVWTASALPESPRSGGGQWLVFANDTPLADAVVRKLIERGLDPTIVRVGEKFERRADESYSLNPSDSEHYELLLNALDEKKRLPDHIIHFWSLVSPRPAVIKGDIAQTLNFDSIFSICRALQYRDVGQEIRLVVVTAGSQCVGDETVRFPERATLLGPCRVVSREMPNVTAQLIDVDVDDVANADCARFLLNEFDAPASDDLVALRGNQRWTQKLEATHIAQSAGMPKRLRNRGVYLITGGLGEIALSLVDYLALEVGARLVLVSRRDVPSRDSWIRIAGSNELSEMARCIRRIVALESKGAEILVLRADAADHAQMRQAVSVAEGKFGPINGIFHAAGVMVDGPIVAKSIESTRNVLGPKIAGGLVLDEIFPPGMLDIFAVFSSASVFLAPAGQIDYVAANAFLDALAASRDDGVSIQWGIWGDIGMAARAYGGKRDVEQSIRRQDRLLLGVMNDLGAANIEYEAVYDPSTLWVLSEHVVGGRPVLPGTAYVEIARSAMDAIRPAAPIEIRSLSITEPMVFSAEEPREVRVRLTSNGETYKLSVMSRASARGPWLDHASAILSFLKPAECDPKKLRLSKPQLVGLAARSPSAPQESGLVLGPRWQNIKSMQLGPSNGIAEIELAQQYLGDLKSCLAHPALTDMAATFGIHLLDRGDKNMLYVPFTIDSVRLYAPLPARFTSHVKLVSQKEKSFAIFDVVLVSEEGAVVAAFKGFTLRCVPINLTRTPEETPASAEPSLIDTMLSSGIRASDAPKLFQRILNGAHRQTLVSSMAVAELRRAMTKAAVVKTTPRSKSQAPGGAPLADEFERPIADFWSELLGSESIQLDDDFFALGGHSLAAVRLFAKIRKQFGVDLPLATLFQAPTLKALAAVVAEQSQLKTGAKRDQTAPTRDGAAIAWSPIVLICRGSGDRLPFFCVHGGGGNVLNMKAIADHLGSDQPFYGLQAQGVDGRLPPLDRIEAMATKYVEGIRTVDPRGPYCLAGYSGGGVIAFEMAQQLTRVGAEVSLLVLMDTLSPHAAKQPLTLLQKLWSIRRWSLRYALGWPARVRDRRNTMRRRNRVQDYLVRNDLVPQDLLEMHLMDSYLSAQGQYEPLPYSGSAVLLKAQESETQYISAGWHLGWENLILGGIEVHEVSGSHFTMMSEPAISEVAAVIREHLDALNACAQSEIL